MRPKSIPHISHTWICLGMSVQHNASFAEQVRLAGFQTSRNPDRSFIGEAIRSKQSKQGKLQVWITYNGKQFERKHPTESGTKPHHLTPPRD